MADEIKNEQTGTPAVAPTPAVSVASPAPARQGFDLPATHTHAGQAGGGRRVAGSRGGHRGGGSRGGSGGRRAGGQREERTKPEFDQKMLNVRRVARVVAGGRRFSFSVLMVIGNRKGSVGVGTGKAGDTALAIEKATKNAKKHMLRLTRTSNNSIPHVIEAKYGSASIVIFPAKNKGLIAGSAVRSVLELAGVTDVNAKIRSGSKNKLNIAQATIAALKQLHNANIANKAHANTANEKPLHSQYLH